MWTARAARRRVRHCPGVPATSRPTDTAARFRREFGDDIVTRARALDAGFSRGQLRSALHRGLLESPRHGLLRVTGDASPPHDAMAPGEPSDQPGASALAVHISAVRAALQAVGPGALASHESAAILHGLARPSTASVPRVTLVRPGAANWSGPGVVVRGSGVPDDARTIVHGVPATGLARTAIDLARGHHLPDALIPLDHASRLLVARRTVGGPENLRHAVHDEERRGDARDELVRALSGCWGWPGATAVRSALPLVDPASESPLESRSRGWFLEAKLPPLEVGFEIRCDDRRYWADFAEPGRRVVGEADGLAKYGSAWSDVRERIEQERHRQADLERHGWRVVRWLSTDRRAGVVARMSSALGLG